MPCEFPEHHGGRSGPDVLWVALAIVGGAALWGALALLLRAAVAVLVTLGVLSAAGVALLCVLLWRDRGTTWRPADDPAEIVAARALAERARLRQLAAPRLRALPGRAAIPGDVLSVQFLDDAARSLIVSRLGSDGELLMRAVEARAGRRLNGGQ